jgi:hypothetical protein
MTYSEWVAFVLSAFTWKRGEAYRDNQYVFHGYIKEGPLRHAVTIEIHEDHLAVITQFQDLLTREEYCEISSSFDLSYERFLDAKPSTSYPRRYTIRAEQLNLIPWVVKLTELGRD